MTTDTGTTAAHVSSYAEDAVIQTAADRFVRWLDDRLLRAGRGDDETILDVEPSGRFWLGRLGPEDDAVRLGLGDRGERLDPCACGIRLQPRDPGPWRFTVAAKGRCWLRTDDRSWRKSDSVAQEVRIDIPDVPYGTFRFGEDALAHALRSITGEPDRSAEIRVEVELNSLGHPELTVLFVNTTSSQEAAGRRGRPKNDPNLYEVSINLVGLATRPFLLESLPDSFRYDRKVPAYGINCGVLSVSDGFETSDTIVVETARPTYWSVEDEEPDLSFSTLATRPLQSLTLLVEALTHWGETEWGHVELERRSRKDDWQPQMLDAAKEEAAKFWQEVSRIRSGLELLQCEPDLLRAFQLMNRAMTHLANGRYDRWRPFQIGFLLANLKAITDPRSEGEFADIVWFATGGGKTETYLGLLVTAGLWDRLRGKSSGITAWSRFPLRMLSLQQTQRFADAMAGAELVRRQAGIPGDPFAVGFFVGQGATPNAIRPEPNEGDPDPEDDDMPARYQVLLRCPFCHGRQIDMVFNRRLWRLEHQCSNSACPWPEKALPFFVVDEEIYRFLPTTVVGTLDKAASIALQAAMRSFVGAPRGICSEPGHGYTYAPRATRPNGCLVPGCRGEALPLPVDARKFAPTFRLQDELHLLRDSLGAVDSHYEALFDSLQTKTTGHRPKILASSATLAGYEKQVDVLYQREARVFPLQGPRAAMGFWSSDTSELARRFVAIAPRGVTLEFAVDRMMTYLQNEVRRLISEPDLVCREIGVGLAMAPHLLSIYGTDILYGNSLRDLDAATRSLETQVPVNPPTLNTATLTGRTEFTVVREVLERLDRPESDFIDRVHVIAASSMMSHGVDIDRLNVMVLLGVPLTTAEFIQTTARVGRRWPALVYLMHKVARERDASVYRSFEHFVRQGDRFVEPVPITRRSRRVLERSIAGLELARILAIHEPKSKTALSTVKNLRRYFADAEVDEELELYALVEALGVSSDLDEPLRSDMERWVEAFFANLLDPTGTVRFPSELCPWGKPMISLRDVEQQAPIRD